MPTPPAPAAAAPHESELHWLAVCLSIVAGFVDAVAFLQLGGIYASFMSGNSTRLGVSVTGLSTASVFAAMTVGAFMAGVIAGSLISTAAPVKRKPLVLLAGSLALSAGATLQIFLWNRPALLVAAAAMGCINMVFRAEDGPYNIGITYMTGNLVKLADGLAGRALGRRRTVWPFLLLWLGLLAGAGLGAVAYRLVRLSSLWFAAAAAALLTIAGRNIRSPSTIDAHATSG